MEAFVAVLIVLCIVGAVAWRIQRDSRVRSGQVPVVVKTVKGDRAAEREISRMLERGYTLKDQGSRKMWWSLLTGPFTRRQKHTLTFVKPSP